METKTQIYERKQAAYRNRMQYLAKTPLLTRVLHSVNTILTYAVFLLYPLLLVWVWKNQSDLLFKAIIIPFNSFIILSVFRYYINRKRPYEAYGVPSAIHKSTTGKSFPSRHVFSAFVIAMTFIYVGPSPIIGIILLLIGTILGALRVILGVHYFSDVIVGAFVGILTGFVGYGIF